MATTVIKNEKGKSYMLDTSLNRITLLDGRFYYAESGNPVPSVTTLLEAYPKGAGFYKWLKEAGTDADDLMVEAGRRGTNVHDLTERYDKGELISLLEEQDKNKISMREWQMFERYVDFTKRFNPVHEMVEQNFVSEKLGWAGTVDRPRTIINGKRYLIDIKTGGVYDHYWCQLAAYRELQKEMAGIEVDDVAILHLNANIRTEKPNEIQGIGWKLYTAPKPHAYYLDLFQSTRKLWYALNGDAVPKVVVHQLTHKNEPAKPVEPAKEKVTKKKVIKK